MNIIVCLDDDNGMLFHKRRQSQDQHVREDLLNSISCNNEILYMNEYSAKQFKEMISSNIHVTDDFINLAEENDWCFVENLMLKDFEDKINEMIIYRWNRKYPSDMKFDLSMDKWKLVEITEFSGKSHEKITKEKYARQEIENE